MPEVSLLNILPLLPPPGGDSLRRAGHAGVRPAGVRGQSAVALAAFIGMLLLVGYRFAQEALLDWKTWALMAAAWIALWRNVDLLLVVGVGAVLSLVLL